MAIILPTQMMEQFICPITFLLIIFESLMIELTVLCLNFIISFKVLLEVQDHFDLKYPFFLITFQRFAAFDDNAQSLSNIHIVKEFEQIHFFEFSKI
jgi:hypothetical protein